MKLGDKVENFKLTDQFGNQFDLYENLDKNVLLVFYPKDNTLVCTTQLKNYSSNASEWEKYDIKVIGINIDPIESHKSFCLNNGIDFPVLSDPDKKISKMFEALNIFGQNKRKLIFIDKSKKVKFIKSTLPFIYLNSSEIMNYLKQEGLL
jgi:peroxiredoxin